MINGFIIFIAQYLFLIGVAVFVLYFVLAARKKKMARKTIFFGLLAFVIAYAIAKMAGYFYFDSRPFIVEHFIPLIAHENDNGFPSDHTLFISILGAILYPYNKRTSILVFLIALLVGFARVYAGVHHPIDVAGGIMIAAVASIVAYNLSGSINQYFARK